MAVRRDAVSWFINIDGVLVVAEFTALLVYVLLGLRQGHVGGGDESHCEGLTRGWSKG